MDSSSSTPTSHDGSSEIPQHVQAFWRISKELDEAVRRNDEMAQMKLGEELTFTLGRMSPTEKTEILNALQQVGAYERTAYIRSGFRSKFLRVLHGAGQMTSDVAEMVPRFLGKTMEILLKSFHAVFVQAPKAVHL